MHGGWPADRRPRSQGAGGPRVTVADRVLVTGAGGFIGSRAVDALVERGLDVHAAALRAPEVPRPGVTYHRADLLGEPDAVGRLFDDVRPTHLLHLAWTAAPGTYRDSLENYQWVGATLDLARRLVAVGGARMVAAGTCVEYDPRFGFCSEAVTPAAPTTPYGVAKDATRRLLESFGAQTDLATAWGRVFFVYGPGERLPRLVPSVIRALLGSERALCTEGSQVRDFLHVRDVADAFVALLLSGVRGAVNISSGDPVSVRSLVSRIAAQLDATDRVSFGALPSRDEAPFVIGDPRRLRSEVGWRPRFDLDRGLSDTIEWWKAHR